LPGCGEIISPPAPERLPGQLVSRKNQFLK